MKLIVLADNNTYIDQYYLAEPALSIYIEKGEKKYLFDTGYSDVYLKNAANLEIEIYRHSYFRFFRCTDGCEELRGYEPSVPQFQTAW